MFFPLLLVWYLLVCVSDLGRYKSASGVLWDIKLLEYLVIKS